MYSNGWVCVGFLQIDDRGEWLELYDNVAKSILGQISGVSYDYSQRLAHMPDFVFCEWHLRSFAGNNIWNWRQRYDHRPRSPIVAKIGGRIDGHNAFASARD